MDIGTVSVGMVINLGTASLELGKILPLSTEEWTLRTMPVTLTSLLAEELSAFCDP